MGWFILYIVAVLILHITFSSFLPASILSSKLYSLFLLAFPFIFFVILGCVGKVLERKGIINPSPPKTPPPVPLPPDVPIVSVDTHAEQEAPECSTSTLDDLLDQIDRMDGIGFERICSRILRRLGYTDIRLTKSSGDQGVDIVAVKEDVRYAFQCKCYSSDLGNRPVQEVHAGKSIYGCHVGVVITNRYFTSGAKELADATGVLLWDRDKLTAILLSILSGEI